MAAARRNLARAAGDRRQAISHLQKRLPDFEIAAVAADVHGLKNWASEKAQDEGCGSFDIASAPITVNALGHAMDNNGAAAVANFAQPCAQRAIRRQAQRRRRKSVEKAAGSLVFRCRGKTKEMGGCGLPYSLRQHLLTVYHFTISLTLRCEKIP